MSQLSEYFEPTGSKAPSENQSKQDDDQDANHANSAVPEAIAVSTKAATEAPKEKNDGDDEKIGAKRHDISGTGRLLPVC